jgi:uncharacterized protein YuzE
MPGATYDPEADVLYVQLTGGEMAATQKFLDDRRILDYSADGAVVGVEFICASEGVDLSDVPFAQSVESLIGQSGRSFKIFA